MRFNGIEKLEYKTKFRMEETLIHNWSMLAIKIGIGIILMIVLLKIL